jgi:hypothetical protein
VERCLKHRSPTCNPEKRTFRPCVEFRMADNSVEAVTWCVKCECATTVVFEMDAYVPLYSA